MFEYEGFLFEDVKGIIVFLVVLLIMFVLECMCEKYFKIKLFVVGFGIKIGLNIKYENLCEVGVDWIVNVVVGIYLYGSLFIIVDFGMVIIYCYINEEKYYMGGVIMLGIMILVEVLYSRVVKFFCIEIIKLSSVVGKNIVSVM